MKSLEQLFVMDTS